MMMNYLLSLVVSLWNFLKTCVQAPFGYQRLEEGNTSTEDEEMDTQSQTSSKDANSILRLLNYIDENYGSIHPTFFTGQSNNQSSSSSSTNSSSRSIMKKVFKKARDEYKLLIIYLHSDNHQNTDSFCKDVLCTEGFKEYVDENFLFFAADVATKEGHQLVNELKATTFPFLSVIMMEGTSVNNVAQFQGETDLDTILVKLIQVHENITPRLVVQRADDQERNSRRNQIEQQNKAYEAALEADKKKMEELKIKEEEEKRKEEKRKQKELEIQKMLEEKEQLKINNQKEREMLRNKFNVALPKSKDTCLIRFRFPNGSQMERTFNKNDKAKVLYEFVHCLDSSSSSWTPSEESTLSNYQITTNFPKKEISMEQTLQEQECYPKSMLFVHEDLPVDDIEIEEEQQQQQTNDNNLMVDDI